LFAAVKIEKLLQLSTRAGVQRSPAGAMLGELGSAFATSIHFADWQELKRSR
jgi:hypothetical protein